MMLLARSLNLQLTLQISLSHRSTVSCRVVSTPRKKKKESQDITGPVQARGGDACTAQARFDKG